MKSRLLHEMKQVLAVTLFFAIWYGLLISLKELTLAEYDVKFVGLSIALVGALVTAKVVILLDLLRLSKILGAHPPVVEVIVRTFLYTAGVAVILLIERAFELRHESTGARELLHNLVTSTDTNHVWAKALSVGMGMFIYNLYSVIKRELGGTKLAELLFTSRLPG